MRIGQIPYVCCMNRTPFAVEAKLFSQEMLKNDVLRAYLSFCTYLVRNFVSFIRA